MDRQFQKTGESVSLVSISDLFLEGRCREDAEVKIGEVVSSAIIRVNTFCNCIISL
jgi:hypothetical protein